MGKYLVQEITINQPTDAFPAYRIDIIERPGYCTGISPIKELKDSIESIGDESIVDPNAVLKLNNEKETKKMKAKKCDRCGKLYENPVNGENCGAEVRFRYLPVDGEENLSEKKIIEKQTKNIYISSLSVDVDICPDCRESFKRWFENG